MAMEVTILKVGHEGEEFGKVFEYLREHPTDAFSPEIASLTEVEAKEVESGIEQEYLLSRKEFKERLQKAFPRNDPDRIAAYSKGLRKGLYKKKIPVWFLERFSPKAADESKQTYLMAERFGKAADLSITSLDFEGFLNNYWEMMGYRQRSRDIRDREIAKNLGEAENRIRSRYPVLNSRDPLKLTMQIGASHRPEKYTSIPVSLVDLIDPAERALESELNGAYRQGRSLEKSRRVVLAYAVWSLGRAYNWGLPTSDIQMMGEPELIETVRTRMQH